MPLSLEELDRIKKLAVTAMFSDDELMETLVLKGGNALDLIYKVGSRASGDLDFSMDRAFTPEELKTLPARFETLLQSTFEAEGYKVFDVRFSERPLTEATQLLDFWGGYKIEFKVINASVFERYGENMQALRNRAADLGKGGKKSFEIEISKFEYTGQKQEEELEGYTIFVYTPAMIVCEKLRAICQQMPDYAPIVLRNRDSAARARDFFDIYIVMELFKIDLATDENKELLRLIFGAKRVPIDFLSHIHEFREFHRTGYESVAATVKAGTELNEFDFYFDYVIEKVGALESLWVV